MGATASRVDHWLLVEHSGYWPYDPLEASSFAGSVRDHLGRQLAQLRRARLLLIKRPGRFRQDRLRVVYGASSERGRRFFGLEIRAHSDLVRLDFAGALEQGQPFGEPLSHPLLIVCTHGKRDRCCARYGQQLCEALHNRANPSWVWQSSHVGGDRFAGNLVCLPEGLYFGRVGPDRIEPVLDSYLAGRINLDHYRGRSCYPFAVQAAELEVRRATGLSGFYDLRLVSRRRRAQDAWTVRLETEVAGEVHELEVEASWGDETYLTCRADGPRRPRRFVVRSHRIVS